MNIFPTVDIVKPLIVPHSRFFVSFCFSFILVKFDLCFLIQYHSAIRKRCSNNGLSSDLTMQWISVVMIKRSKLGSEYLTINVIEMCSVTRNDDQYNLR